MHEKLPKSVPSTSEEGVTQISSSSSLQLEVSKENTINHPVLSAKSLGRQVQNRWVWQGLNFELYPGEGLGIAGPSGAGKSLLLRAIAGLDPVQAGKITFADQPLASWSMPHYRSMVIYLHQRPAIMEGTVEENFRQVYTLRSHRDKVYNRHKILEYLEILGRRADFLERHSSALSGGEAQIVAFLRVLQLQPQILLFDEPTASLDAQTTQCFEDLVKTWLTKQPKRAYLWTSHDPVQLTRVINRSITISSDQEISDGK
ncbi:MAG: ATP-binding cassette domain-containing protein [Symploca sp. SIO3C6]|nr:ATP-binding cassette domain-containing protein [Symploca sp. SIO3C6]